MRFDAKPIYFNRFHYIASVSGLHKSNLAKQFHFSMWSQGDLDTLDPGIRFAAGMRIRSSVFQKQNKCVSFSPLRLQKTLSTPTTNCCRFSARRFDFDVQSGTTSSTINAAFPIAHARTHASKFRLKSVTA